MKVNKDYSFLDLKIILPWIIFAVFGGLAVTVLFIYQPFAVSFFSAILIYILFRTAHEWLKNHLKLPATPAALLSTILIALLVLTPFTIILITLIQEAIVAVNLAQDWFSSDKLILLQEKYTWFHNIIYLNESEIQKIQEWGMELIKNYGLTTLKQSGKFLGTFLKLPFTVLLTMFILFFLFKSGSKIGEIIYNNLPFPDEMEKAIGDKLLTTLEAVIRGNLFVSILQGLMIGSYFWFFGLPTPVLYGFLGAFFALIPIVGTAILWLPGSLYLYAAGYHWQAWLLAGLSLGTYLLLENFVKPIWLDKSLNLHPLFLFLAILGGLSQFGLKGLIIGPVAVVAFLTFWELLKLWNQEYGTFN